MSWLDIIFTDKTRRNPENSNKQEKLKQNEIHFDLEIMS